MKTRGTYSDFQSRFICLKCGKENSVGAGIYRRRQREKFHVKDLTCLTCGEVTKNVEIRNCDFEMEIREKVPELAKAYYGQKIEEKEEERYDV